jgi:hypothetical protein
LGFGIKATPDTTAISQSFQYRSHNSSGVHRNMVLKRLSRKIQDMRLLEDAVHRRVAPGGVNRSLRLRRVSNRAVGADGLMNHRLLPESSWVVASAAGQRNGLCAADARDH